MYTIIISLIFCNRRLMPLVSRAFPNRCVEELPHHCSRRLFSAALGKQNLIQPKDFLQSKLTRFNTQHGKLLIMVYVFVFM